MASDCKRAFLLTLITLFLVQIGIGQKDAEKFEFQYENKTLRGLIEKPKDGPIHGTIVLIPGYGRTNFVEGNWFGSLRDEFVAMGLAVLFWDKMGCGESEGEFDANQPVQRSAAEALIAIRRLQEKPEYSSLKIGLWGLSRAGWICPLIIDQHPLDFWISASGTDDKETYGYLLHSNLLIHGKSALEAQRLYKAWQEGHRVFCTGGTYEEAERAIAPLKKDTLCQKLFGYSDEVAVSEEEIRKQYYENQRNFTSEGHFDPQSGLWVYVPSLKAILSNIECPVLAIFGEKDSQVDWKRTMAFYQETLGKRKAKNLKIETLTQCNHNIQKCENCGFGEDLSKYNWQACEGYYQTMKQWLVDIGIIDS